MIIKKFNNFKLFEHNNIFEINTIFDVEKYIRNNEINEIRSDKTIIHELIALEIDYENGYDGVMSIEDIIFSIERVLENNFKLINYQDKIFGDTVLLFAAQSPHLLDFKNLYLVDLFIKSGADMFIRNNNNELFFDLLDKNQLSIVKNKYNKEYNKYMHISKSRKFNL